MTEHAIFPWQKKQWQHLQGAFEKNRLSHAYLLSGPEGIGKAAFAATFSEFLLSTSQTSVRFRTRVHPDFLSLTPEEKSKTIKIDQIRELRHQLSQTAHAGGYQVAVINPADTLPVAASNALLKTLEEPPGRVIIFLIDHQTVPLLPTIISRCQKINFSCVDQTDMLSWLQSQFPDEKNLDVLLRLTGFAPLKIPHWIENNYLTVRDQLFQHLIKCLKKESNLITPVPVLLKHDVLLVLQLWLLLCIDLSRAQFKVNQNNMINIDLFTPMQAVASLVPVKKLQRFIQQLLETKNILARGVHLNTQLCLENLLIEWESIG